MRYIIPLLFCLLITLSACGNNVGVGVGVGTGTGNTRFGMGISTTVDFLRGQNNGAVANNRRGLEEFRAKDFEAARKSFEYTLKDYPEDPDATYYLGLSLIYLGERDAGLQLLKEYKDSKFRIQQDVRWWAGYCEKKPSMTPEEIHKTMKKARAEGYNKDREEYIEDRGFWW